MSVSKGVDYYTFVDEADLTVSVTGPKVGGISGVSHNFHSQNLQIDSSNIPGWFNYTGTLAWSGIRNGTALVSGHEDISSLTGNTEGGSMGSMLDTPSTAGGSIGLSYGFYDAGSGIGTELPNQDQLYVYLTDDRSTWMQALTTAHPQVASAPFYRFVLPGAHDAGMFYLGTVQQILASPVADELLPALTLIPVIGPIIAAGLLTRAQAPRVIINLAMTQKDNITTMLNLGVRYFDFRPGTLYPHLNAFAPNVRYHQHSVIPGYPYIAFLSDVLSWLATHPGEIVVVSANTQGFADSSMNPSADDIANDLTAAFNHTGLTGKISTGDKSSLSISYVDLIQANKRLIFLNQINGETAKYDSYSDSAYATLTPGPIIAAFEAMHTSSPTPTDYTVLQMQATSTNLGASVLAPSIITLSDASSPLLCTKARIDIATNPWILSNAASRLPSDKLLVLLNDFADNCMATTAATVTLQRVGVTV